MKIKLNEIHHFCLVLFCYSVVFLSLSCILFLRYNPFVIRFQHIFIHTHLCTIYLYYCFCIVHFLVGTNSVVSRSTGIQLFRMSL